MAVILTEGMILEKSKGTAISNVKKLNFWGRELKDVSIVKHLSKVEVLSLSVNCICTLKDFEHCISLRELYLRNNNIADIKEILHLKNLPNLHNLWLAENPCTKIENYRATVLRVLPHLQKLDNVEVHPDEVATAKQLGSKLCEDEENRNSCNSDENREGASILLNGHNQNRLHPFSVEKAPDLLPHHSPVSSTAKENLTPCLKDFSDYHKYTQEKSSQEQLKYADSLPQDAENWKQVAQTHLANKQCKAANILYAVLHLIKELDLVSLEVLEKAVSSQIQELKD